MASPAAVVWAVVAEHLPDGRYEEERMSEPTQNDHLARHVDESKIQAAIDEVESRSTGKIEVVLASHFKGDVSRGARHAFRLDLAKLPHHNGILFFVVPSRREIVVWGDAAIHKKVGQQFWDQIVAAVRDKFKAGDLTGGLVHGIELAGQELARHFPV